MKEIPVVIIGAGPAGITLSCQLQRYGISHCLFEKDRPGGLVENAFKVENFPLFPRGITGLELARKLEETVRIRNLPIVKASIKRVDFNGYGFQLESEENSLTSRVVAVASGTEPEMPEWADGGISTSGRIFSDIRKLRDVSQQKIGIIGAGDAAFDYALSLSDRNYVWIFNRGRRIRCLSLLEQAVDKEPRIRYLADRKCMEIDTDDEGIKVRFSSEQGDEIHSLDYLLCAVGRIPATGFLGGSLLRKKKDLEETGRLYIIGDAANGRYRQAAIAAGDGLRAAMKIKDYFDGQMEKIDYVRLESTI